MRGGVLVNLLRQKRNKNNLSHYGDIGGCVNIPHATICNIASDFQDANFAFIRSYRARIIIRQSTPNNRD